MGKSTEVYGTVSEKVKDGELLKGMGDQASSVAGLVTNYSKSGWSNLSSMWSQQSNYQQPCEQSNLLFTSGAGGYMQKVGQMAETIKTFQVAQIDPQILLRKTPMTGQAGGIPGVKATSQKVFLRAKNRRKKLLRKSSKMTIKIIN